MGISLTPAGQKTVGQTLVFGGLSLLFVILNATPSLAADMGSHPDLRLIDAVKRRDHKAIALIARDKAAVNAAQPDGATALAWAAYLDDRDVVETLLSAGAKVNTAD